MKRVIPIALILLLAIVGCKLPGSTSSNAANNGSTKDSDSVTSDPKASVSDALKKFRNVPFVTVKFERSGARSSTTVEQYSATDESYSSKSESGEDIEVMIVGKENFSRMNTLWPWKKDSGSTDSAAQTFFFRFDQLSRWISGFTANAEGQETVDGKAANVFRLAPLKSSPELPTSIKIWIDKEKGLPLKFEFEMGKESRNIETFDYQTPVKIEKPALDKK